MRRTAMLIGLWMFLAAGPAWSQGTSAYQGQANSAAPHASANPMERGAQWIRGKFARQQAAPVDPVNEDGPPAPPMPPRSILRSSKGVPPTTQAMPAPVETTAPMANHGTAAAPGTSSEDIRVQQRIRSVEQMLKGEEARMQQQLAQFARMREAALKKEDANALRQIEQMERQTVAMYQKRIDQALAQMPAENASAPDPSAAIAQPTPPAAARRTAPPSAARPGRYRMPFGR